MANNYHRLRATRVFVESMFAEPKEDFDVSRTYKTISDLSGFSVADLSGESRKSDLVQYKFAALAALYVTSDISQTRLAERIKPDRSMLIHAKDMVSSWFREFSLNEISSIPLERPKLNFEIMPYETLTAAHPQMRVDTTDYPYDRGTLVYHLAKGQNPDTPEKALQFVCQLSGFEPGFFWAKKRDTWHVGHRNALYALLEDLQKRKTHTYDQLMPFVGNKHRTSLPSGSAAINRDLTQDQVAELRKNIPNIGEITTIENPLTRTIIPTCHFHQNSTQREPEAGDIVRQNDTYFVTIGTVNSSINERLGGVKVVYPEGTLLAQQITPFTYNGPKLIALKESEKVIGGVDVLKPHTISERKIPLNEERQILHPGASFIIGAQILKEQHAPQTPLEIELGLDITVTRKPKTPTQLDLFS
ncbi:MAG: hypothetical protein ACI8Y7_000349 [Candidatus Woesearchaeota archaeon]|jgi:hypothetical protein